MTPEPFDALTLEIERADVLAEHLAQRLSDLSEGDGADRELYALSLVAESMREKHARILEKAKALLGPRAKKGGA
jgi:hypothetical protein